MPTPSPSPCPYIGPAAQYCNTSSHGGVTNTGPGIGVSIDPMQSIAQNLEKAAAWMVEHLGATLDHGVATIGFSNSAFITQYAISFGAATFLTLLLWVFAVLKRVVAGAPLHTAFGEAIGFLWMTVIASAFTPLILQTVTSAVDALTQAIAGGNNAVVFGDMATALRQGTQGGGPVIQSVVSLTTIGAGGALWLELVMRSAALLAGGLLAPVVYAGMVDRAMWPKIRRWAGFMGALILLKPMIVLALSVAKVFTGTSNENIIVTGLVVIGLALFGGMAIFRFIPGYGDEIRSGWAARAVMSGGRTGLRATGSAANWIAGGIATHGDRAPAQRSGEESGGRREQSTGGVSEGIQTHGNRNRGGSTGKAGGAATDGAE